ncbi:MAG: hypothetical protein C0467_26400 [Planctomycetaceae bacterium]|nr:hypothetical protein [Planctomycetaceae bacterium]
MHRAWCAGLLLLLACSLAPGRWADDTPKSTAEVSVTDLDGKQAKVAGAKLTVGTRRLAWIAGPKGTPDEKLGPLALKVREAESTTLVDGVLTLIPAASVESAKYDYEKLNVSLTLKGWKDPIVGTLQYKGLNTLGVAGTVDGKATTFTAGVPGKAAVKTVTFPDPKPLPAAKAGGAVWAVQIVQKEPSNPTLKVRNLKVLYHYPDGSERLASELPVRKGPAIPLDEKLTRFEVLANDTNTHFAAAEVEVGGAPEKLVIIPLAVEQDKKVGTIVGLLGEIDTGYKLFPLHTIKNISPASK